MPYIGINESKIPLAHLMQTTTTAMAMASARMATTGAMTAGNTNTGRLDVAGDAVTSNGTLK